MIDSNLLSAPCMLPGSGHNGPAVFISGLAVLLFLIALAATVCLWRAGRRRAMLEFRTAERARNAELHLNALLQAQADMQGRMQTMAEIFGTRQAELNEAIRNRLDGMAAHIGQSLRAQSGSTHENLTRLQERLAVIDSAQNNIRSLAGQVVELQAILSNKQTRGAFGQRQMEAIIRDALPFSAYAFQPTLSNGTRPDCIIHMPNGAPCLVIDAKFPLEAWNAMRHADNPQMRHEAENRFRRDMEIHIRDIAHKYLIAGETQDTALLFVPSESVFATIYEEFEPLIRKAGRARVTLVSPSLLMLSIQVVQAILKDARMREQARLIRSEVSRFVEDVARLDERARKLQSHFRQTEQDVHDILISTAKLARRGARIEALEPDAAQKPERESPRPAVSLHQAEED